MKSIDPAEKQTPRPSTTNEVYQWAQAAFRREDFDGASSLCRQILEVTPDSVLAFDLLAASLYHSGKIGEEIDRLKSAVESGPDTPGLYEKLGELQRVAGDPESAAASLEQAAAADPDNPFIRVSLGMVHYGKGDLAAAEREFTRVLELQPGSAPAHFYLGRIHWKSERWEEARRAYSTALEHDANYPPACHDLAELLYRRDKSEDRAADLKQAADLALRAIGHGLDSFENRLLAGKILIELELFAQAREILEAAAGFPERHPDFYVALSVVCAKLKENAKARSISLRLMREFPVESRRAAGGQAEVLVLECLNNGRNAFTDPVYGWRAYANANTIAALPAERVSLHHTFVHGITGTEIESFKDRYNVIYNNVANAELNCRRDYSERVQNIVDRMGLPVINPPALIDLTTREKNYQRLHNLDHLIFPATLEVNPTDANMIGILLRVEAAFEFPVLVRPMGTHRGRSFEKVDDIDALRDSLARFTGRSCYVIQYHESKHPTGNFLRYRGVFIGGKFYPLRMNLDEGWLVIGLLQGKLDQTLIEASGELQDEEKRWLADPAAAIGQANFAALHAANDVIKLDFYGLDFGIAGDGRAIVFEANACMNCLSIERDVAKFPYLEQAAGDIKSALEDLLIDKAQGRI